MSHQDLEFWNNLSAYRRPASEVMRLHRMGSSHQTRLSFMRVLLRRLKAERWKFKKTLWQMDERGFGQAVYTVTGPRRSYSLVAFSHELADDQRSDRVIATAWDATFALFDGIPDERDIERLKRNVPLQEAGRIGERELSLSRANRSVRLWAHVVEKLARGEQPDCLNVEAVGYLMRTTAVYGSGKFGAADRQQISDRDELKGPFQAEMLSVWLTRAFVLDLVEYIAACKGGEEAVSIEPELRRRLGVGNSTGLGMAPFIMNHPVLIHNWVMARETAFATVRALQEASIDEVRRFGNALVAAGANVAGWHSEHIIQREKLAALRSDIDLMKQYAESENLTQNHPWDRFYHWSQDALSTEGQELLLSLMLEPYGELVDSLADGMHAERETPLLIDGSPTVASTLDLIHRICDWASATDYELKQNRARFWYTSQEKLEPRLGERFEEPGAELEHPLASGFYINQLEKDLQRCEDNLSLADFLLGHPEHRHAVRRLQLLEQHPYAEVRDNLIGADLLPIDLLRFKLAFFGAERFDPRSDRWVRICMYQGAPFPHELLEFDDE